MSRYLYALLSLFVVVGCESNTPPVTVDDSSTNQPYSVIAITTEVDNTTCPSGGVIIETGVDSNGNSELDATEITESYSLCNGVDSYANRLEISDEPAGDNCLFGGKKLEVGTDDNNNNQLDPGEITDTQYFCSMIQTLTEVIPENPGANCQFGGSKVISGPDLNGNGILDDANQTSYFVCTIPNLLVASHTCRFQLGGIDQNISVQYRLDEYRNGEIDVTGEIISPLHGISRSVRWNPWLTAHETSWENGAVRVNFDILTTDANSANGGYWLFDLDRDPDSMSIFIDEATTNLNINYLDDDLTDPLTWGPVNIAACIAAM